MVPALRFINSHGKVMSACPAFELGDLPADSQRFRLNSPDAFVILPLFQQDAVPDKNLERLLVNGRNQLINQGVYGR